MNKSISISTKDKITSIRVTEKTKKMLETFAIKRESHDEILQRVLKLAGNLEETKGSVIKTKGNVTMTNYESTSEKFNIQIENNNYEVVCKYNDLTRFAMFRKNAIKEFVPNSNEWELNLELVNIKINGSWVAPEIPIEHNDRLKKILENQKEKINFDNITFLAYLAIVKKILESTFDVVFYEVATESDLKDTFKWREMYEKYNLSMDSYYRDIQDKISKGSFKRIG